MYLCIHRSCLHFVDMRESFLLFPLSAKKILPYK
uniref:Uncharacterized protein n=1 Tax=Siphoviridae sp. ctxMM9 TaxID=2827973 RepID=A0A8S5T744_9CAUD|nr:MAG TPA: hypothetical protein [Siphoviridae sp. ctxMM9]